MLQINIMSGLPGSGKTHYINAMAYKDDIKLHRDEMRANLREALNSKDYFPVSSQKEYQLWLQLIRNNIAAQLDAKEPVAIWIDQTTLNSAAAAKLIKGFLPAVPDLNDIHITFHVMYTSLNTCLERDAKRTGFEHVGEDVIRSMASSFRLFGSDLVKQMPELDQHFNILRIANYGC